MRKQLFKKKNLGLKEWSLAKKTFVRLLPILQLGREYWPKQATISFFVFLLVPLGLINPYITQLTVDGPLLNRSPIGLLKYGAIMGVISMITMLITNYTNYRQSFFTTEVKDAMTRKIYKRLSGMSIDYFKNRTKERTGNILGGDGVDLITWGLPYIPKLASTVLNLIMKIVMVFIIDWRLGLTALFAAPFYLFKANILARRNRLMARIQRGIGLAYTKELRDSLGTIDVVKTFRTEGYHENRVFDALKRVTDVTNQTHKFSFVFGTVTTILIKLIDAVPVIIGALLVSTGKISLGQLSAATIYVGQCIGAQAELINQIPEIASKAVPVKICTEFLKQKPSVVEAEDARDVDFSKADIVMDNVSFSYIPGIPVLQNISCVIKSGRWTGIKAPSGYGKTTLLNLILRLYDVQGGQILINGVDVRKIKFKSFADQTSTVLQQMFFQRDTFRRVIAYDRVDASLDEIREAARLAGIDDMIISLPEGYDTSIGEAGCRMSHGQRQRVMIARALLRKTKILILDESFASIDRETEDRIVAEMKANFPDLTVIVVSHHQSVLDKMDEVIDLTKIGKVLEPKQSYQINYFDLGFHEGQEIDLLLTQVRGNPFIREVNVYGIEANPVYYEQALEKYHSEELIKFNFYHFAVSSKSGIAKLYDHDIEEYRSIYPDRLNCKKTFIEAPQLPFSEWLKNIPPKKEPAINILKANISGAEWDLLNDLSQHELFGAFDLYLGPSSGGYKDIEKVASLRTDKVEKRCREFFKKHGIYVQKFSAEAPQFPNVDINEQILRTAVRIEEKQSSPLTTLKPV